MLVKLALDKKNIILVDHTQVIVELQYQKVLDKEKWYAGLYVRDGIENREEPLGTTNPGFFVLSDRRLLNKESFSNLSDAEKYMEKIQEYINKQLDKKSDAIEDIADILQSLNDANDSTHKLLHDFINKQATSLEKLVELLTPVPKPPKKTRAKKEESSGLEK